MAISKNLVQYLSVHGLNKSYRFAALRIRTDSVACDAIIPAISGETRMP